MIVALKRIFACQKPDTGNRMRMIYQILKLFASFVFRRILLPIFRQEVIHYVGHEILKNFSFPQLLMNLLIKAVNLIVAIFFS